MDAKHIDKMMMRAAMELFRRLELALDCLADEYREKCRLHGEDIDVGEARLRSIKMIAHRAETGYPGLPGDAEAAEWLYKVLIGYAASANGKPTQETEVADVLAFMARGGKPTGRAN